MKNGGKSEDMNVKNEGNAGQQRTTIFIDDLMR